MGKRQRQRKIDRERLESGKTEGKEDKNGERDKRRKKEEKEIGHKDRWGEKQRTEIWKEIQEKGGKRHKGKKIRSGERREKYKEANQHRWGK